MISFPRQVFLRNERAATLHGIARLGPTGRVELISGKKEGEDQVELWLPSGRWSYLGHEHPFDIVSLVTPDGKFVAWGAEVLA